MECFRLLFDILSGKSDSRKPGSLWGMMISMGGVRKSIHQSWLAIELGLLCWGFKGVQKRFLGKRPALFKSGQWHFQQDNAPSLSQAIWPRWASRQFPTLPIVQTLLPVTFTYSQSSEAVVMRQLRKWEMLRRRSLTCSHKRTSMGPSRSCWNSITSALQPEEITSKGTRVSCV